MLNVPNAVAERTFMPDVRDSPSSHAISPYHGAMTLSRRIHPRAALGPRRTAGPRLATVLLIVAAALVPAAFAQSDAVPVVDLPVTRLVATTSGLATFEHAGVVTGTQELVLSVPVEAMDDLLQSLVLQDFGGGTIRPVRYGARDAIGRVLASYAFDLRQAPGLAELLAQARGEEIVLAGPELSGTLLSVEREDREGEPPEWFLTIVADDGLRRVPLSEARSIRFARADLQQELNDALAALAGDRARDQAELRIRFEGEGERQVRVAYVRDMPVWKTSYRLVVAEDGSADLQGWAILDNPTDLDLVDVDVTFLAGRPISFVTELFGPVYVERPRIAPDVAQQIVPEADAGAFADDVASEAEATRPSARAAADEGMAMMAAPLPAAPELQSTGVEAATSTARTASAYAYRIDEPVTVGRHASAMVPIVQATIPAQRLTVVDASTAAGAPLRAVSIDNDSDALLAAGTVTLYDEAGFAGNARLADLAPGGQRLLRYAGDLGVRVASESTSMPERIVSLRIDGGLLVSEVRLRTSTEYRIERDDDEDRLLVVEHPLRAGWEVVQPEGPAPLRSDDAWRFGVELGGADDAATGDPAVPVQARCDGEGACRFEVVLERVESRRLQIANLSSDRILLLLSQVEPSAADRSALEAIAELQLRVSDLDTAIAAQQTARDDIYREQNRIRENMRVLERNSSLYRRYLDDLADQEDELDVVLTAIERFRTERQAAQADLDAAIRSLSEAAD